MKEVKRIEVNKKGEIVITEITNIDTDDNLWSLTIGVGVKEALERK